MRQDRHTMRRTVLAGWGVLLALSACASGGEGTWWIWHGADGEAARDAPAAKRYFRRVFDLPADPKIRRAQLVLAVDNGARVWVNGRDLGRFAGWKPAARAELTAALRPGRNVVAVEAANVSAPAPPNPAGLAGRIVVQFRGREPTVIPTDRRWLTSAAAPAGWVTVDFDDRSWPAAKHVAGLGQPPWGAIREMTDPNDLVLPRFVVPGHEAAMGSLQSLLALHYPGTGPKATLWDPWLPKAALWPATGQGNQLRAAWRAALLSRKMHADGYVSTHQHRGLAHNDGWPFPLWTQVAGAGFHFAPEGQPYPVPMTRKLDGWSLADLGKGLIDAKTGLHLKVTEQVASLTTPPIRVDTLVAPFIRLAWQVRGLPAGAKLWLEWTTDTAAAFAPERRVAIGRPRGGRLVFTHVELYRHAQWRGRITRLRVRLEDAKGAELAVRSLITAVDSRHNINNSIYIHGCDEYARWTGDVAFLRAAMPRLRRAMRFAMTEFRTREHKCVFTPWVGHDGRSGLIRTKAGQTVRRIGMGVGNNYWDLLPFGGRDCLATIYYYHAVRRLADLERSAVKNPAWRVPQTHRFDPTDLDRHAAEVKRTAGRLFWNDKTQRFVAAIDADGKAWDYGLTFVNLEAIYYGFAADPQAKAILAWLSGERIVEGDTSAGADIYHWRFGPRSTTRRNIDYYTSVWTAPHSIPWGYQVQDGGAVLGFTYFDLMARLRVLGPDDAWRRLKAIVAWFDEVRAAGGYRKYYGKDRRRGTLQGGGPPGGLGMDREFFESALVPQVMLYGFLGVRPELDGLRIRPALPADWPELTIDRIRLHGRTLRITASRDTIRVHAAAGSAEAALRVYPPPGTWRVRASGGKTQTVTIRDETDSAVTPGGTVKLTRE